MSSFDDSIFKQWKHWCTTYYSEFESNAINHLDTYIKIINQQDETEKFAYYTFMSMTPNQRSVIDKTPFYVLSHEIIHQLDGIDIDIKIELDTFLSLCWKEYIRKVDDPTNQKTVRFFNALEHNPNGAIEYLKNIPTKQLFTCHLYSLCNNAVNINLDKMKKYCATLSKLKDVHNKEEEDLRARLEKINEIKKMKEILSTRYVAKCASEYSEYTKVFAANYSVSEKIDKVQNVLKNLHQASEMISRESIIHSIFEDLQKHVNLMKVDSDKSMFKGYQEICEEKFREIRAEIQYLFDNSKSLHDFRSLIDLNDTCKKCFIVSKPLVTVSLEDAYTEEVKNDLINSLHGNITVSLSNAFRVMSCTSDQVDNSIMDTDELNEMKASLLKAPETPPVVNNDTESNLNNTKKRKFHSPVLEEVDKKLQEYALYDAYRVGSHFITKLKSIQIDMEVKNLIMSPKHFFQSSQPFSTLSETMNKLKLGLERIDISSILNQSLLLNYTSKYEHRIVCLIRIMNNIRTEFQSKIVHYTAVSFTDDPSSASSDELMVPYFKVSKLMTSLDKFRKELKKTLENEKFSRQPKVAFVNSFVSEFERKESMHSFNNVWKYTFCLIILYAKSKYSIQRSK